MSDMSVRTDFSRPVHALLGVHFDGVTLDQAAARLRWAMSHRERCLWVTPNINFVVAARDDAAFRSAILKADLSTVDGMPLVWLAKLMGIPLPERVSGSDVFDALCKSSINEHRHRIYLFGGEDGAARAAHEALNAAGGAVQSVGYLSPGVGSAKDLSRPAFLSAIGDAKADFLMVSLGAVKGHQWIDSNWRLLDVPVVSHLGAVINFLAGSVRRAPVWMQKSGLEWAWRIQQENSLWKRYFNDGIKLFSILRESSFSYIKLKRRWQSSYLQHPGQVTVSAQDGQLVWVIEGVFTRENVEGLRNVCETLNRNPSNVHIDASQLLWLDSAAMGLLLLLCAHQARSGKRLSWGADAPREVFVAHGCGHVLNSTQVPHP